MLALTQVHMLMLTFQWHARARARGGIYSNARALVTTGKDSRLSGQSLEFTHAPFHIPWMDTLGRLRRSGLDSEQAWVFGLPLWSVCQWQWQWPGFESVEEGRKV